MKNVILVSGPLRSGTSALAAALHSMGVPMAVSLMAPIPPDYRSEWEDVPLSFEMGSRFPLGTTHVNRERVESTATWMQKYIKERWLLQSMLDASWGRTTTKIGAKSPLLLFAWSAVGRALKPYRIIMHRDPSETKASIRRTAPPGQVEAALKTNEMLHSFSLMARCDLRVEYEALVKFPRRVLADIASALDIQDEKRVNSAAETVELPLTEVV